MEENKKGIRMKIRIFAAFLAFLLVCTIVSRGVYAANLPMVKVGMRENKVISQSITANVELEAQKEVPVFTSTDVLIDNIMVSEGQTVNAGDVLMTVDLTDLEELIRTAEEAVSLQTQKLAELDETNLKIDQSNAEAQAARQRSIDSAAEDLSRTTAQDDAQIARLQAEVDELSGQVSSHNSEMPAADSEEYPAWKEAQDALEASLKEKQEALEEAKVTRENNAYSKQKDLENAQNTPVEKTDRQSESSRMELTTALEEAQARLDELEQIKEANGEICTETDGVIEKLEAEIGTHTTESPVAMLGDYSEGLQAKAVISEDDRKKISTSDKMSLSFMQGGIIIDDIPIQSIVRQADGTYQVAGLVDLDSVDSYNRPEAGMLGEMTITVDSNNFNCCLPLSALHSDGEKDYILKLEERDGFLGKQYYARRVNVTIKAKDNSYAGMESDSIADGDEIILESDKEVLADKEVRLYEEE